MRRTRRKRGANDPTGPRMLRALQREARAIEMRLDGATYEEIAKELGMSVEGARSSVLRAIERVQKACLRGGVSEENDIR